MVHGTGEGHIIPGVQDLTRGQSINSIPPEAKVSIVLVHGTAAQSKTDGPKIFDSLSH